MYGMSEFRETPRKANCPVVVTNQAVLRHTDRFLTGIRHFLVTIGLYSTVSPNVHVTRDRFLFDSDRLLSPLTGRCHHATRSCKDTRSRPDRPGIVGRKLALRPAIPNGIVRRFASHWMPGLEKINIFRMEVHCNDETQEKRGG
jgi:hypothetical protein